MDDASDMELLRQYAERNSEAAFGALVSRHMNLVYSTALRNTGNPDAADEIAQAVFIILAKKAARISEKVVLPGWLYQTARLTAASFLKSEIRRVRREQAAYMQTELRTDTADETWKQLAPLLEDAMGRLKEQERSAVVLRFFGDKSFAELATAFGVSENAAKKQVSRALEKLHRYFSRRGVSSTTAMIALSLSANSVQAAPVALATSATKVALANCVTSSSPLVQEALKIMASTKLKVSVGASLAILLAAGTVTVTTHQLWPRDRKIQTQKLADGSVLSLENVKIGQNNEFLRGNFKRRIRQPETLVPCLTAEFKLSGAGPDNALISREALQRCRAVISGEDGLEYVNNFFFLDRSENDYFGQLNTCLFPRDSRELRIRIQQRDAPTAPWTTIADFAHRHLPSKEESWQPEHAPVTREADGMQISIGEVTLQLESDPISKSGGQYWNRTVAIPWRISRGGVAMTNWMLQDLILRDSSGNAEHVGATDGVTDVLAANTDEVYGDHVGTSEIGPDGWTIARAWQSPDPRKVWKVQAQVAEKSSLAKTNVFTLHIPVELAPTFETNVSGYPFRVEFLSRNFVSTRLMLSNRTDLRLNYLHAEDQNGEVIYATVYRRQFGFTTVIDTRTVREIVETVVIGNNIPIEFTTKPRLLQKGVAH